MRHLATILLACALAPAAPQGRPLRVLIIDGQNNHAWQQTTPVLRRILGDAGRFLVDVSTTPPHGGDMSRFNPDFSAYDVVLSNYNGDLWSPQTRVAFEKFVRGGGGFVSYHAADNAFPEWKEYQDMIGVGGWGDRTTQKSGPALRMRNAKWTLDPTFARCGNHGERLPFAITTRDASSPIVVGLPLEWMHAADELYDTLCGPAQNVGVIATAYSDPKNHGSGEQEPMLMAIRYGKGRVFHTTLGHDMAAMECVGFITTLQRGTEWAAIGLVTQPAPPDFPGKDKPSVRRLAGSDRVSGAGTVR
jgi:type 1 glutamine amidotransferase